MPLCAFGMSASLMPLNLTGASKHPIKRTFVDYAAMLEITRVYEGCEIAQTATRVILAEIMSCTLEWRSGSNNPVTIEPSRDWMTFVRDTVINGLTVGFSPHVRGPPVHGRTTARALHPSEFDAYFDEKNQLVATMRPGGRLGSERSTLTVTTIFEPHKATGRIMSPAASAVDLSRRHRQMVDNYMRRDGANSSPAVYTEVRSDITANGDTSSWFTAQNRAGFDDREFLSLMANRGRTMDALSTETERRRDNKKRKVAETDAPDVNVVEHDITDGMTSKETRHLQSQHNDRHVRDNLSKRILGCYHVTPQVMSEQQNSERAGVGLGSSSHAMVTRAVQIFDRQIDEFISFANAALATASKTPKGAYVVLFRPVRADAVARMTPFLTTDALIKHYSRIYGIPESEFDVDKVEFSAVPPGLANRDQRRSQIEREQAAEVS